ncbi:hypothetical protein DPEC_G00355750 [Dallia pectoralis]|uniref:Uncharacterized protein n=1 Tax=Dallia pectoralis TaxID=75939 RepID=A0ACC2EZK4_DALPE|nr:hypothetical protein DPEC_G00355750 [Dallia pectoralis]
MDASFTTTGDWLLSLHQDVCVGLAPTPSLGFYLPLSSPSLLSPGSTAPLCVCCLFTRNADSLRRFGRLGQKKVPKPLPPYSLPSLVFLHIPCPHQPTSLVSTGVCGLSWGETLQWPGPHSCGQAVCILTARRRLRAEILPLLTHPGVSIVSNKPI